MKLIKFLIAGIVFGIVMTKSEAISWYRIHEMFRFESFHMYGIITTAVIVFALALLILKSTKIRTMRNTLVQYSPMNLNVKRHLLAGTIFGLGWALMGACPGPMFVMLGHGFWIFIVTIIGATIGTYTYGVIKDRLPH